MPSAVKNSVLPVLLVAVLAASACRRDERNENADTPPPPAPPSVAPAPVPTTTSTSDHTEVFRRAFWRQPASADRILQAERRVNPDNGSWQWFIQLHPSPELLAALRDPDTFGLLPPGKVYPDPSGPSPEFTPTRRGSAPPLQPPPPAWFPDESAFPDFEILQSPSTGLTILHRATDNMLFATDSGSGFAPPAR